MGMRDPFEDIAPHVEFTCDGDRYILDADGLRMENISPRHRAIAHALLSYCLDRLDDVDGRARPE